MSWVWGGSPTHTLSPALFSHPLSAASCLGYVSGLCRPVWACFFFSAFLLPVCSPSCVVGLAFSHPGLPLSWIRSQLAHTGPTGRVCCFAGVVSLPGCQNRTRRHTGASLVFTAFSWYASFAEVPQAGTPGGNSPHREWEGSYKAASRFSQCRLMSTPLSARFR